MHMWSGMAGVRFSCSHAAHAVGSGEAILQGGCFYCGARGSCAREKVLSVGTMV